MDTGRMSGYLRPVEAGISCSWACHLDRDPPSTEAGTDYACAYGTPVLAAEAGTVVDVKHDTGSATGRFVTIDLDDGRRTRDLHLSGIWVGEGQRVSRGQAIAASGASGFGSNWGYGAHLHRTLFPRHEYTFGNTLDFEVYVGDVEPPPPPPREDDEVLIVQVKTSDGGGVQGVCYALSPGTLYVCRTSDEAVQLAAVNNPDKVLVTLWDYQLLAEFDARGIPRDLIYMQGGANWAWAKDAAQNTAKSSTATSHPLLPAAWVGGFFLGLIGLVEVVRFVVDLLV
jgi:hypothetical protein